MAPTFSKYTVSKPAGGDTLVKSGRTTIYYYRSREALYALIDTYLVKASWVSRWSWENDTEAVQSYTYSYTTQLNVTQGQEVTNSLAIGKAFDGLTFSMGSSEKTFSPTETTASRTTEITVIVPARTRITFYQRMYEFRCSMSFILDAWSEDWDVVSRGGSSQLRKECEVQIMSEDCLTTDSELSSSIVGSMTVPTVPREQEGSDGVRKTRARENLTNLAEDALSKMWV